MSIIYEKSANRKGLIFVKNPRTAGGSVKEFLVATARKNNIESKINRMYSRGNLFKYENNISVLNSGNYEIFSVIRNPWDRFVSILSYLAKLRQNKLNLEELFFEDLFLDKDGKLRPELVRNLLDENMIDENSKEYGCTPIHYFYHAISNQCDSFLGIKSIQVIRYENLAEDLLKYTGYLGLNCNIENDLQTNINCFGRKSMRPSCENEYRECYTEESKALILNHYIRDIEAFGYSF